MNIIRPYAVSIKLIAGAFIFIVSVGCATDPQPSSAVDAGAVADTSAPDTTVADTTAPDTTVADTTVADTTAPDTTAPDTTVADTTVADSAPMDGETTSFCPVSDYQACGGVVTGTWSIRALCPDDPAKAAALCEHPFGDKADCTGPQNTATCTWQREGSLTFKADGSAALSLQSRLDMAWTFNAACLAVVKPNENDDKARCMALIKPGKLACVFDGASCRCTGGASPGKDESVGVWSTKNNQLIFGKAGKKPMVGSYCVSGDSLIWDVTPHPTSWRYWLLERQP